MCPRKPARKAARRTQSSLLAALVVVSGALICILGRQSLAFTSQTPVPSSSSAPSSVAAELLGRRPPDRPPRDRDGFLSEAGGVVPDGVTVFDDGLPAVAKLDPALLSALRHAAADAAGDGVEFYVTSGWRSSAYQEQLHREAVSKYGSPKEAARWVATPTTSAHVSGDAVDVGSAATAWLSRHGAEYGLCQIYDNELWHYELRPDAIDHGCPARYADPTHDPRMQQ